MRLDRFTGIDRVHTGMEVRPSDRVPKETRTIVASSASHEVALRTRAPLRDDRLPHEHRVHGPNFASGDDGRADQLPALGRSAHH
jgi:hypothetical protein